MVGYSGDRPLAVNIGGIHKNTSIID